MTAKATGLYKSEAPGYSRGAFLQPPQREEVALSPADTSPSEDAVAPPHQQQFEGVIGNTISESTPDWPDVARAPEEAPNILLVMLDDVGFGQLGSR